MKRAILAALLATVLAWPAGADFRSGLEAYERGDYAASLKAWAPLAEAGDARAQFRLGGLYETGQGVRRDDARALLWYLRAARKGHRQASGAVVRMERRHPKMTRRLRVEERQRAELRRLEEARRKAKAEAGRAGRRPSRRSRARWQRAPDRLSIPVPSGWTRGGAEPLGEAAPGIGDVLKVKAEKELYLPSGETPGDWSEIIVAERFPKPGGWGALGLHQALIRKVNAGCDYGDGPEPRLNRETDRLTVQSFYACTRYKGQKYGVFMMIKTIESEEELFLIRRLWRGTPFSPDGIAAVAARFEGWPAWFERVSVAPPGAAPENARKAQETRRGFGFFVSRQGHIVTPQHVVKDCGRPSFSSAPGRLLASDPVRNLALFKVRRKPSHVGVFREGAEAGEGEPIIVAGYPEEGSMVSALSVTAGVVGAPVVPGGDSRLLAVTASLQPGISGAPLLDLQGRVAGMAMAKAEAVRMAGPAVTAPTDMDFALSARVVREFLTGQGVAFETAPAGNPLTPADAGDRARTFTVSVECR